MSMDPSRWVKTLPASNIKSVQEKYDLDSNRWVNTLSGKDDDILILSNVINSNPRPAINSNQKSSSGKKYSFANIDIFSGEVITSCSKVA